jgi:hypothetical protein
MLPSVTPFDQIIPTYPLTEAGPIPTACDPEGVYPYTSFTQTAKQSVPKSYRCIRLENEHLVAVVCPDTGGRLISLKTKNPAVHLPPETPVRWASTKVAGARG